MPRACAHRAFAPISLSPDISGPIGREVYRQLKELIRCGRLPQGARLPSTRQLAAELGVSRNTVVFAYEELKAENYIVAQVGAGSYVAAARHRGPALQTPRPQSTHRPPALGRSAALAEPGFLIGRPFEIDLPAIDVFPHRIWARIAANRATTSLRELLRCAEPGGYPPLRSAIADHVRETRGIECGPDQVIVVTGQGQAISLAAGLLIEAGDEVLLEEPTHVGVRQIIRAAGAGVVAVPIDDDGFDIDAARAMAPRARIALVTPSSHFPLGIALGVDRRIALGMWAAERPDRWILEDDTGHDLTPTGAWRMPIWSRAPDRVIYFSSFRPTLAPSLRLGFMVVPEGLVDAMLSARLLADGYRPPMEQAILNDFMAAGHYARHVRAMRQIYAQRHLVLSAAVAEHLPNFVLPDLSVAGLHTICRTAPSLRDTDLVARADGRFVLRALSSFYDGPTTSSALLLGHAQMNGRDIPREIKRLAASLQ